MGNTDSISADPALEDCAWLRSLARSLIKDAQQAEDAAQDTWVAALEHRPSEGRIRRGWLASILRNRIRQDRRGGARRLHHEGRAGRDDRAPSTGEVVERLAIQKRLLEAVDSLDEPYRTAIVMRFFDGLPPREIARRQGRPVKTVDTHIARALVKLRGQLDEDHGGMRSSWLSVLLPLAETSRGAPTVGVLTAIMNLKLLVATFLALGSGALVWWGVHDGGVERDVLHPLEAGIGLAPSAETAPDADVLAAAPEASPDVSSRSVLESGHEVESEAPALPTVPPTFVGYTRDPQGQPVAGLEVGFVDPEQEVFEPAGKSDASGRFELPLPDRRVRLDIRDDVYCALVRPFLAGGLAPREDPILTVAHARDYAGVVRDETGRTLAGVDLRITLDQGRAESLGLAVFTRYTLCSTRSDEAGVFEFRNVPWTEALGLRGSLAGYDETRLELPPIDDSGLVIELSKSAPRANTIFGLVRDPLGSVAADVQVSAGGRVVSSDPEGRFQLEFEGNPEGFLVRALKLGYGPVAHELLAEEGLTSTNPVILELGAEALSIRGRAFDAHGEPLAGVVVQTFDLTPFGDVEMRLGEVEFLVGCAVESILSGGSDHYARTRSATSDAQGNFVIAGLLPQTYTLHALHPRTRSWASAPAEAGGVTAELHFTDVSLTPVAGRVLSLSGSPLVGLSVRPQRRLGGESGQLLSSPDADAVVTDAEGRFSFEGVQAEGLSLQFFGQNLAWSEVIDLDAHEDLDDLALRMAASAQLRVTAAGPLDGGEKIVIEDVARDPLQFSVELGEVSLLLDDMEITSESSSLIETDERARWIVLQSAMGEELMRLSVQPDPQAVCEVHFP